MTKDEKLDEFLKRIGIELLPFQKEFIKKIADENKIYVCYPPHVGRYESLRLIQALAKERKMRELCELLENITEEGYTVLFGQYDGSDELYIRISKKGASIVGIVYDESMLLWQINELFEILKEKEQ
jgi:hypothetical protein